MEYLSRRDILTASLLSGLPFEYLSGNSANGVKFNFYPSVKFLISNKQTAIFNIADFGNCRTLILIINGIIIEAHTLRNGIFISKDMSRSQSQKQITPIDFNRLINAAGGVNRPVNNAPQATSFYAIYNSLPVNHHNSNNVMNTISENNTHFALSEDPFFANWRFEFNPKNSTYFSAFPSVRAAWTMETFI